MSQKDKENRRANSALSLFFNRKRFFLRREVLSFLPTHACVTLSFFLVKQVQEAPVSVLRNLLTSQSNFPVLLYRYPRFRNH